MKLLFLTSRFPYGLGEAFIEREIEVLSGKFENVDIVPVSFPGDLDEPIRQIPANVHVRRDVLKEIRERTPDRRRLVWRDVGRTLFWCLANRIRRTNTTMRDLLPYHLQAKVISQVLQESLSMREYRAAYSYWLDLGALALVELKRMCPKLTCVSRAHGYDLYSEASGLKHRPYQYQMIRGLDRVYPCSEHGTRYLGEKYPDIGYKLATRYLGVTSQTECMHGSRDGVLRIVSCSTVIPKKRVHLVIEAIREVKRCVEWTHIGDGPLWQEVREKCLSLSPNVKAQFPGGWPHSRVLDFYRRYPIDLFVNTSETEGLPVTLMEAMSFGIPCCAPRVGGIPEILQEGVNGYLMDKDLCPARLTSVMEACSLEAPGMRRMAQQVQRERFDAEKNYAAFASELVGKS